MHTILVFTIIESFVPRTEFQPAESTLLYMVYCEKELTPPEVERIWRFINKEQDEETLNPEPRLLWKNNEITEFEFDYTFVLDDTEI